MNLRTHITRTTAFAAAFILPAIAAAAPEHGAAHGAEEAAGHGAEAAHGAHDSSLVFFNDPTAGEEKTAILWLLVNFAVLMFILNKLLFQPLKAKTAAKHDAIKEQLDKATAAHDEAEKIIAEYRGRMERLDDEISELKADAKTRAESDRKSIIEAANAEAERIKASAKAAAERDASSRRKALENEILDRALEKAEAALRKQINPSDQQRMVGDYVGNLDGMKLTTAGQSPNATPAANPTGGAA